MFKIFSYFQIIRKNAEDRGIHPVLCVYWGKDQRGYQKKQAAGWVSPRMTEKESKKGYEKEFG